MGKAEDRQKKQETAHRQFLRAENVIVEWQRANEKLPSLQEASEREDQLQMQAGSAPPEAKEPLTPSSRNFRLHYWDHIHRHPS